MFTTDDYKMFPSNDDRQTILWCAAILEKGLPVFRPAIKAGPELQKAIDSLPQHPWEAGRLLELLRKAEREIQHDYLLSIGAIKADGTPA